MEIFKNQSDFRGNGNTNRISWWLTGLFIAADMAGGALVVLPAAMVAADWIGATVVMILSAVFSAYTAIQLGNNWIMLQERWPEEYKSDCRNPYSAMGFRAIGPKFKILETVCLILTQFGISVAFLLLSSKNLHYFLKASFQVNIHFCYLIIIVAICLLPFAMIKNLRDSRQSIVAALVATTVAVILILVGSFADASTCRKEAHFPPMTFKNFFLAFGTISFAFGGHSIFPTIQQDMENPRHFRRAVILGFTIVMSMYVPVSVLGFTTYGDSLALSTSVIFSLQTIWIQQSANFFITLHIILIMTMFFHPVNQQLEAVLKLPQTFGWERVLVRTATIVAIVFVAESVTNFGAVLSLVGGSTMTLMMMVFPCITNLFLAAAAAAKRDQTRLDQQQTDDQASVGQPEDNYRATLKEVFTYTPRWKLAASIIVISFGLFGGAAATLSSIHQLVAVNFPAPCYSKPFLDSSDAAESTTHTYCCGHYQNISRYGNSTEFCTDPFPLLTY